MIDELGSLMETAKPMEASKAKGVYSPDASQFVSFLISLFCPGVQQVCQWSTAPVLGQEQPALVARLGTGAPETESQSIEALDTVTIIEAPGLEAPGTEAPRTEAPITEGPEEASLERPKVTGSQPDSLKVRVDPNNPDILERPLSFRRILSQAERGARQDQNQETLKAGLSQSPPEVAESRDPGGSSVQIPRFDLRKAQEVSQHLYRESLKRLPRVVELRIDPPELGEVTVFLSKSDESLAVRFLVKTPEAARALAGAQGDLERSLYDLGLLVSGFSVEVGTQGDAGHWESPRQRFFRQRQRRVPGVRSEGIDECSAAIRYGSVFDHFA